MKYLKYINLIFAVYFLGDFIYLVLQGKHVGIWIILLIMFFVNSIIFYKCCRDDLTKNKN